MTIAKRLLLLIFLAVGGLFGIGTLGLVQIGKINESLLVATDNTIPSLDVLADVNANFLRFRSQLLYHVLSTEKAAMDDLESQMAASRNNIEQGLQKYVPLITDDKDRAYLETSRRLFAEYYAEAEKALVLSRQNRNAEARDHLIGPGFKVAKQLIDNMAAHAKYNDELADIEKAKARAAYDHAISTVIVGGLILAALIIGIGLFIYRHVSGSLQNMANLFTRIEKDLDFTQRVPTRGSDEVATTSLAFNRLLDRLQHSLREVGQQAHAVSESAGKVSSASEQMSSASSHQSESASSMAATMEEMTVSINHVADRAGEADSLSRSSGQLAQDGTQIIGEAVQGIDSIATTVHTAAAQISQLEQNSERVNSVIAVIKEVADQTNLLALNAAIEAARAGEQGRGFAVVADEVRKLAERTSQSTHEIATTISEMQNGAQSAVLSIQAMVSRVENGVALARKANAAIGEIGKSSEDAVHMVADISEAIREQSSASTSLAQEVEKIAQMSEENSAAAHSTANTANELARLSRSLQNVVAQYRV